jgi:hypothetical protein
MRGKAGAEAENVRDIVARRNVVLHEMSQWMEKHEYESIPEMRGSMSRRSVPNRSAFDRANYIRVLSSYALNPRRSAGV